MTLKDYYDILDLPVNSSIQEIKKAFRIKARLYHPDINPSKEAKDLFIRATEAYEFLLANHEKIKADDQAYNQAMEDWRKYRQDRSRKHASAYASASYGSFKNSSLYKTTKILDGTVIIISFVISVLVIIYTVAGYIWRLNHPFPGLEKPSVITFIMLLTMGMFFLVITSVYLIAFHQTSKKHRSKNPPIK
jgi:curved DNA-binding protein CbpA